MPGPTPSNPETRQRRNKVAGAAKLSLVVNHEVPPMPPAADWLVAPMGIDDTDHPTEWSQAVKDWWEDIWSSPMSNEYHDADVHGLYLACFYLQQTLNPYLKMSDRLNASKSYENAVKNFGLTPLSRRSLQWEIERADQAQAQGQKRRARSSGEEAPKPALVEDPRHMEDEDLENPFDKSPEFGTA
ncbi:terminase small subunit [Rhodococcus phage Apiary]|nr:terminase small subunit [Rhodococcus phage Braxoaddie]WNM64924.1 terminase small subunit [Rhodococcus phage Maselop]WNM67385.1 terminase small subunit [Rhodococcus phage Polyyuki]WNM69809.1 terminase small subunit [Rhodococcus phage Apiary]